MAIFVDYVQGVGPTAVDKANRVQIGSAMKLVGPGTILEVWAIAHGVGTVTADKPQVNYISIESDHIGIAPFHFPAPPISSHLGATPSKTVEKAKRWVVNREFPDGAELNFYATGMIGAPVSAGEISVMVKYSNGGPEGPPVHMVVTEPGQAPSASDDGVVTGADLDLIGATKAIMVWAFCDCAAGAADKSVLVGLKLTSAHFQDSGPCKFHLRGKEAHDATDGWGGVGLTIVVIDRDFKSPPTNAKMTPQYTSYDAMQTVEAYVGVAYI